VKPFRRFGDNRVPGPERVRQAFLDGCRAGVPSPPFSKTEGAKAMPIPLTGSCRCGAVAFSVKSHTPHPYQLCYCTICRKTGGGGGYAINIMGVAASFDLRGGDNLRIYRAELPGDGEGCALQTGTAERHFCIHCGSALWISDPTWPDLVHPFASAIDTDLPVPPERVHMMLRYKASWVEPAIGPHDRCFDEYPEESIEDWHRRRGLWID